MNELNKNLEKELITKFIKFTPEQQQQVLDFVDFLIWREQKRNSNLSGKLNMSEIKNDDSAEASANTLINYHLSMSCPRKLLQSKLNAVN